MPTKQDKVDLHKESLETLNEKLNQASTELVSMRFAISINKSKHYAQYSSKRREIARLKTIIHQKHQTKHNDQKAS
jgi:ribosomal protein L29